MLLYLIRHGEPDYKNDCLTENGKEQAQKLAKKLFESELDKIYSSPLGRAKQTAEYTASLYGKTPEILPWAKEIGGITEYPDGTEKNVAQIPNVFLRTDGRIDLGFNDSFHCDGFKDNELKEEYDFMISGALSFLEEQGFKEEDGIFRITRPNTEKIAIFCHGNMIRSLVSYLLHIPIHLMWAGFGASFTSVTVVNFNNSQRGNCAPRILVYNDISHLRIEGKGIRFNKEINI